MSPATRSRQKLLYDQPVLQVNPTTTNKGSASRKPTRKSRKAADPWTPKRLPKGPPKPKKPKPTHYTCRICIEEQPISSFIPWVSIARWTLDHPLPLDCISHLTPNPYKKSQDPVCRTCISSSMAARLETVGARSISEGCLERRCHTPWTYEQIMAFLPASSFEAYNMGMFAVFLQSSPVFTCPNQACQATGILDVSVPGYPQIECPNSECALRSCVMCNVPWHKGQTCTQYAAEKVHKTMSGTELDTLELMHTRSGKRCPNCLLVIEKDGGCNSMYCGGCNKYFNWETAALAVPHKGPQPLVPLGPNSWLTTAAEAACEADIQDGKAKVESVPTVAMFDGRVVPLPYPADDDFDL